ncbi:hypothetical protein DFH09DRAFT_1334283 [Mycena vulgaris]|nr:hypothetical protein DFH09DRAFT_1334283 [Mycena vulgaris]
MTTVLAPIAACLAILFLPQASVALAIQAPGASIVSRAANSSGTVGTTAVPNGANTRSNLRLPLGVGLGTTLFIALAVAGVYFRTRYQVRRSEAKRTERAPGERQRAPMDEQDAPRTGDLDGQPGGRFEVGVEPRDALMMPVVNTSRVPE